MTIYLIFRGSSMEVEEFNLWLSGNKEISPGQFVFVNTAKDAYGYDWKNCEIVKIGTWYKNGWMYDVIEDIEHRIALAK